MGAIGLDGSSPSSTSLGSMALANAGGLRALAARWAAMAIIPASVGANAVITLDLLDKLHFFDLHQQIADLSILYGEYQKLVAFVFVPLSEMVKAKTNFTLPDWSGDLTALYTSTALALSFGSATVASQEQLWEQTKGSAAAIGWPLAILGLLFQAFRTRFVTGFAQKHTLLFGAYIGASAVAAWALSAFAPQIAAALHAGI